MKVKKHRLSVGGVSESGCLQRARRYRRAGGGMRGLNVEPLELRMLLTGAGTDPLAGLMGALHGNGKADDSATIQAMIDLANAEGLGNIALPAGTFRLDHQLNFYGQNIVLGGQGDQTILLVNNHYQGLSDSGMGIDVAAQLDGTIYNPIQAVTGNTIIFNGAVPFHPGDELFLNNGRGSSSLVEAKRGGQLTKSGNFHELAPCEYVTVASVAVDGQGRTVVTLQGNVIGTDEYFNVLPTGQAASELYVNVRRVNRIADHLTIQNLAIKFLDMSAQACMYSFYTTNLTINHVDVLNHTQVGSGGSMWLVGSMYADVANNTFAASICLNSSRYVTISGNTALCVTLEEASSNNVITHNNLGSPNYFAVRTGDMLCQDNSIVYNQITGGNVTTGAIAIAEGFNTTIAYNTLTNGYSLIWQGAAPGSIVHDNVAYFFANYVPRYAANVYNNYFNYPRGMLPVTMQITALGGTYSGATFTATVTVEGVGVQSIVGANLEGVTPTLTYYAGTYQTLAGVTGHASLTSLPTAAGKYTVVATYAGSTDYARTSVLANYTIAPKTVTGSVTVANKVYDGTTGGTITGRTLSGIVGTDVVRLAGGNATFSSSNVGAGLTVTAAGLSLSGNNAGNYVLAGAPVTSIASITPASLSITANNAARIYGQANPPFSGTITGALAGDHITATYASAATQTTPVGSYAIVPALNDPNNRLSNYVVTIIGGTLSITRATSMTIVNNASGTYGGSGAVITANVLATAPSVVAVNEGTVTFTIKRGSAVWKVTSGTVSGGVATATLPLAGMSAGDYTIQASYNPAGNANFFASISASAGMLTIGRGTPLFDSVSSPTIVRGTATTTLSGTIHLGSLVPTGTIMITLNGLTQTVLIDSSGNFMATFKTQALGIGKYAVAYIYNGDANFKSVAVTGLLSVTS